MTAKEVLQQLEAMGSAQTRKTYARHGIPEPMFGVSFANLGALKKKLKLNQALAEDLWASGNHDARILATMIADPQAVSAKTLDQWAMDSTCGTLAGYVGSAAAASPHGPALVEKWRQKTKEEWLGTAAWSAVCELAKTGGEELPDSFFVPLLREIDDHVHERLNYVRYSMVAALISMGLRNEKLQKQALAVADHIGEVEVDHGDTSCKTPQPRAYIEKALARKKK